MITTRWPNIALALVMALAFAATACARDYHSGPALYDPDADAEALIDAALAKAADEDKFALLVFGGDWCHDSRGLADHFERSPEVAALLDRHYVVQRIDVGMRHRNLDQVRRFGLSDVYGTPTVVITDGQGNPLNDFSAHDWRTADDVSTADLMANLSRYAGVAYDPGEVYTVDLDQVLSSWPPYLTALATTQQELDTDVITQDAAIRISDYAAGLARSLVRLEMGRFSKAEGINLIMKSDLDALGLEAERDLTGVFTDLMAARDFDMLERFDAQDAETQQAFMDEMNAQ